MTEIQSGNTSKVKRLGGIAVTVKEKGVNRFKMWVNSHYFHL